jgi:EAL domain-containing protein (putative c-di-GMP-specific phosphodiesterase class I)
MTSLNEGLKEKLDLQYELVDALKNNEMYLCFQPKYLINENKIINYEALLRWESPRFGNVSPDKFIRVAEEMGLINEIGIFVLEESCKFVKYMEDQGYRSGVSVNVSPNELNRDDYAKTVLEIVERNEVNPEQIGLELTESVLITNFLKVKRILEYVSARGIKILLDDFGKGYSSLNYIRNLPINTLKIDKSFIDKIQDSEEDRVMVKAIIEIARLTEESNCEGVEKKNSWKYSKTLNVTHPSYLIARPMIMEQILEKSTASPARTQVSQRDVSCCLELSTRKIKMKKIMS